MDQEPDEGRHGQGPGDPRQPANAALDESVQSAELEDEEGDPYVVDQQNMAGSENIEGGGEFPDPHAPPQAPAPGSAPPAGDQGE